MERIIEKLSDYEEQETVTMILFKHYGRKLYISNYRVKFHDLLRNYNYIEEKDRRRFHYYNFIAACYDEYFQKGFHHLSELRMFYGSRLNPTTHEEWKDLTGEPKIFIGNLSHRYGQKFVKIREFQRKIPIFRGEVKHKTSKSNTVEVVINFFLNGLKAELVYNDEEI